MVRLGRISVVCVLVLSFVLASCSQQEMRGPTVIDPFDELVEQLGLTEDQAHQLKTGAGTLNLTAMQVERLRDPLQQILEDEEIEEWVGEARWEQLCDIYNRALVDGEVDLQKTANLAEDIHADPREEPILDVFTSLERLSKEDGDLRIGPGCPLSTSSGTVLYTPSGCDKGDKEFHWKPTIWGSSPGWASDEAIANAISGGLGVSAEAKLGFGDAIASARQRIIIIVPEDDTDVDITATIRYATATTHYFTDVAGTYTSRSDLATGKVVNQSIDPLFGWRDGIEKIAGATNWMMSVLLLVYGGDTIENALRLLDEVNDYDLLHEALETHASAETSVVTHKGESLSKGVYAFEVGLRARAVSVLLGASCAVAIGQVRQIEVTQTVQEEPVEPAYPTKIVAGYYHTVGLRPNGHAIATGRNDSGQCDVDAWREIVQVAAYGHTVGLKSDRTVVATGSNFWGRLNVGDWTDIVQVAAGSAHTVGLKSDGTVVAVGRGAYGETISGWTDIIQVDAGGDGSYGHAVGLRVDGTVVGVAWLASGLPFAGVEEWTDIVQVSTARAHTVGLRSDGTVVAVGSNSYGRCDVGGWAGIVQVATAEFLTVGLKADGTVIAVGTSSNNCRDVHNWTDIVQVAAGGATWGSHIVGLKADGTVVAVGYNSYGQCDVDDWNLGLDLLRAMVTSAIIMDSG